MTASSSQYPAELVAKVRKAFCCPEGCVRLEDCWAQKERYSPSEKAIAALDAINYAQMREALEWLQHCVACYTTDCGPEGPTIKDREALEQASQRARAALSQTQEKP